MKILVFNWQDRLHPQAGGAEAHLHAIFSRLVARGHEVHLVTCGFDGAADSEILDGMHVYRIGTRSTYNLHVPLWWSRNGKGLGVDVVVDDINKIPLMTPLFIKKPIVALVHHLFGSSIFQEASLPAALYVNLAERCLPFVYRSTPMAVVSESTRHECLASGLDASLLSIVYNGIDAGEYPMLVSEKAPYPVITYFGRLKAYKSVDQVIRAFAGLRQHEQAARLWIIGKGDDEQRLRDIAIQLGVSEAIDFHGFVDQSTKNRLLSQSWIVVNSSIKEGWGITNIESNACGTPVVSADSPGLRDSVKIDVSGKLYPYGDIRALQETLQQLITDQDELHRLSQGAVDWASQFSWDQSTAEMESLLKKCIDS